MNMFEENQQKPKSQPIEQEIVQLDNQHLLVDIVVPSGRINILEKVSGIEWKMTPSRASGSVFLHENNVEEELSLGMAGELGISFKTNFYLKRNTEEDDYHDISLTGSLGKYANTIFTVHYLISNSFPVLYCFCYANGPHEDKITKVNFPLGFQLMDDPRNNLYLPEDVKTLQNDTLPSENERMWQPERSQEHRVIGTPYFVMTQRHNEKASACMGFLQHPLSMLEIHRSGTGRYVTPSSSRLDVTGLSEEMPYQFRYQFFPTDDMEAINWLSQEYLHSEQPRFYL
jgi:hypothetical protein